MNSVIQSLAVFLLGFAVALGASAEEAPAGHPPIDEQHGGLPEDKGVDHPLNGKIIALKGGEVKSYYPPVYLDFDGPAIPEGAKVWVEQLGAGNVYPATLRDGQFVFVPKGVRPGGESRYRVVVEKSVMAPVVRVEKKEGEDVVEVYIEDQLFTAYHYTNDNKKPFLWPVLSEGGIPVTRSFPMDETDVPKFAKDHPHHRSWWSAYGHVGPADVWVEGDGSGFQRSGEVTFGSGDAYGWIRAKNTWNTAEDQPVVHEEREFRFYATPEKGRLTDMRVTFRTTEGDVLFKDTKEGGICAVRMSPELSYRNGIITNAQGDVGEENLWGKPSPWCDYSGPIEGHGTRGITIMDHNANLRHPTSWHVRKYGLMGANSFGYSHFAEAEYNKGLMPDNGDYTLKAGEDLTFNYRVYVHSGDVTEAAVADRYADYVSPPQAAWTE